MHHVQMPDCKVPGLSYSYDYIFEIKKPAGLQSFIVGLRKISKKTNPQFITFPLKR